ncbi:hypothetical protein EVAR_26838_1 [Eumeta japonica]|uniref:Uncharacterized protein n=1 Tax=Eumeta variegata TaxID=151549 RepID=A0A4C1VWK3_EUMVA|nr:hypothetical protein EVAR_26838_1 [Eumeta japonica]
MCDTPDSKIRFALAHKRPLRGPAPLMNRAAHDTTITALRRLGRVRPPLAYRFRIKALDVDRFILHLNSERGSLSRLRRQTGRGKRQTAPTRLISRPLRDVRP